jgi:hypothetical protein
VTRFEDTLRTGTGWDGVPLKVYERELLADAIQALREIHEYHCGCDRPGNLSACVATPTGEFEALARLDALGGDRCD